MFGLNLYAIYAMVAISLFCGGFVSGCQHEQASQEKAIREKEHQYQADADKIRTEKDDQINAINSQLVDAISELHKRTSRTDQTTVGQSGTGTALFAEDAEFLIREASRADQIRVGLDACYKQYDEVTK